MLKTKEVLLDGAGRCLELSDQRIRLCVTLDFGPRIIWFSEKDSENLLFVDKERHIQKSGPEFDSYFYPGATWYIYGGHRIWTSPESLPASYYPDRDPVSYEVKGSEVVFTCPPQIANKVAYALSVSVCEDTSKVTLHHEIKNTSNAAKIFAPWTLSVMDKGGIEVIPQPKTDTGLLGNRILALWPYTNMADSRVYWGRDFITLKQDPSVSQSFKLGVNNEFGYAAYFAKGQCFVKHYTHNPAGTYPDFGVSFETYTCPDFLEIETLGELQEILPGNSAVHTETWSVCKAEGINDPRNEDEIAEKIERYVK